MNLPVQTTFLRDLGERVGSTFLQAFLAVVLASATGKVPWLDALAIAGFAAATALLSTLLVTYGALRPFTNPLADMAYRAVVTFGQTLLGYLVAAGAISALDFDWTAAAQASAIAAGTALLKALVGGSNAATLGASVFTPRGVIVAGPSNEIHSLPEPPGGEQPGLEPGESTSGGTFASIAELREGPQTW